jgi:glycosyltransferase involved in cell wall biosynthesis
MKSPINIANQPKVSILVPCYNHERYVEALVLSVINQSYPNVELIVIDDGSTDSSVEILSELSCRFGFKFQHQKNQGVTKTCNRLLGMATGDFMSIVASDDILVPGRIQKQVEYLRENPNVGFVYGAVEYIDDSGEEVVERRGRPQRLEDGNILDQLISRGMFFKPGTLMVPRAVYEQIGVYDESLCVEDYDWVLRVSEKWEVGCLNEPLLKYRLHSEQFTQEPRKKRMIFESELKVVRKWLPWAVGWRLVYYRVPYWFSLLRHQSRAWCLLFSFLFPLYLWKSNYLLQLAYFVGVKQEPERPL